MESAATTLITGRFVGPGAPPIDGHRGRLLGLLPNGILTRILEDAASSLARAGVIQDVCVRREGRICPWDRRLRFLHVMAVVGRKEEVRRICSTGDGYRTARCLMIAWLEFFERLAVLQEQGGQTTSGCAIHTDPIRAAQAAVTELIERDAFLCHWYTRGPAQRIPLEDCRVPAPVTRMHSYLQAQGWELHGFRLRAAVQSLHVVVLYCVNVARRVSARLFLGLGSSQDLARAIAKAYVEVAKFYTKMAEVDDIHEMAWYLPSDVEQRPFGRLLMYQHDEAGAEWDFLDGSDWLTPQAWQRTALPPRLHVGAMLRERPTLCLKHLLLPEELRGTVRVIRAVDPALQALDFANPPLVNWQRLEHFSGRQDHVIRPHPIP